MVLSKPRARRSPGPSVVIAATCCMLLASSDAFARPGPKLECKASGPPSALDAEGAVEALATLTYEDSRWLVVLDKPVDPKRVRLVAADGRAMDLTRPPRFTPTHWFGRGRVIYALGKAPSLDEGKTNIVLVRWARDGRRPRLIRLWSQNGVNAGPAAALVGRDDRDLAVGWGAKTKKGTQWTMGFIDMEQLNVGEPVAMGRPAKKMWGRVMPVGKEVVAIWVGDGKAMTARAKGNGETVKKATPLSWKNAAAVTTSAQCGANLFALSHADGKASLMRLTADGAKPVTTFDTVAPREVSLACAGDAAVVGHRVWNDKSGSVVFWISTVSADGEIRARRVRDIKGDKDDIRMTTLVGSGNAMSAWWAQKRGRQTELFTRPVGCK